MKLSASGRNSSRQRRAFTLTEIMVAMALFSLVVVATVSSHLLGLKFFNITATKLSASHGARSALNHVRDDIRSGKLLYVGNGSQTTFSNIPLGSPQAGNALLIYPTVNTNNYIVYWLDSSEQNLKRRSYPASTTDIISRFVTNQVVFRAEDWAGNCLTNSQNNRVIKMLLEFYQWEFPVAQVGGHYDYYRLQTRMTRRTIE